MTNIITTSKQGDRLRKAADTLQARIDMCFQTRLENTRKRAEEAAHFQKEGANLNKLQGLMRNLATAQDEGTIPATLTKLTSRASVELLLHRDTFPVLEWATETREKLAAVGITAETFGEAKAALTSYIPQSEYSRALSIKDLERQLVGRRIPGFFPTPDNEAEDMVERSGVASLPRHALVVEPSAGKGNICDKIRDAAPHVDLRTFEINTDLRNILSAKGYPVDGYDFLEEWPFEYPAAAFLMNPPFERFQDIDHVLYAYEHLAEGGVIVAIMGASTFFRTDKKPTEFRAWLESVGGEWEKLADGAFKASDVPTGTSTYMVTIRK